MKPIDKEKLKKAGEEFHNNFLGKVRKLVKVSLLVVKEKQANK